MPRVTIHTPAKVNLALSVGAPLTPPHPQAGYHPLASWMACLDFADAVTVEPSTSPQFHCQWTDDAPLPSPIDWPPEKDLACRAAQAVAAHVRRPLHARIKVLKQIPVGAGLGGGSSDAAGALVAMVRAFGLSVTDAELITLATTLGSDVAFLTASLLFGSRRRGLCAVVSGVGETIESVPRPEAEVVLVMPPFGCPTAAVYAAFDRRGVSEPVPDIARVRSLASAGHIDPATLFNDLEPAAIDVEPRLGEILDLVRRATAHRAMVTGSGSSVIVVTPPGQGAAACEAVQSALPDIAVRLRKIV
ncbi:MAG: hypothetical protein AABZ53_04795 [Planctomycetota bacterium]